MLNLNITVSNFSANLCWSHNFALSNRVLKWKMELLIKKTCMPNHFQCRYMIPEYIFLDMNDTLYGELLLELVLHFSIISKNHFHLNPTHNQLTAVFLAVRLVIFANKRLTGFSWCKELQAIKTRCHRHLISIVLMSAGYILENWYYYLYARRDLKQTSVKSGDDWIIFEVQYQW